jgi:hypothetical protein
LRLNASTCSSNSLIRNFASANVNLLAIIFN